MQEKNIQMVIENIGNRIRTVRESQKLSQEAFAGRMNVTPATINRYEKGHRVPDADFLNRLVIQFSCDAKWLLTGVESDTLPVAGDHSANYAAKDDVEKDYVLVPRYDVRASAGGGALVHSEQIVDYLAFRNEWVTHSLGVPKEYLALISVQGDSMEPTLSNNDLILIDRRETSVNDNSIYVLSFDGSLLVKRIQRKLDGSLVVKSDNQIYEPEMVTSDKAGTLIIVGRVVWCGRRM
ncbi:MAG: helix-turn-helix domain-containing protein [Geobacteraceae bacterium]|nr:helix-turn-helix domain-containing protein [Geobacteraceae bacterium]